MRVSFIVPLYNCLPLTQSMLASLQATMPRELISTHEIIFVDDGSTDGTREWLRSLEGRVPFHVLLNERNLGYAAANNRAATIARGELLVLLNSDLVLTPGWLEPMLAAHAARPRGGIVGNVQRRVSNGEVDHVGMRVTTKGKPAHDSRYSPLSRTVRSSPAVTGACLLIDRQLWNDLDGFDDGFRNGGEDVDLCFKARAAGFPVVVAQRSVIFHHVSASPRRKLRDEENSFLLARRWRREFAELGAREWCINTLLDPSRAARSAWEKLQCGLYASGLTRQAPAAALRALNDALDVEFARWEAMFADQPRRENEAANATNSVAELNRGGV